MPPGSAYDHPVSSLDLGSTIVALAGAKVSEDKPLDGVNLIPFLTGENKEIPHKAIYLRQFDRNRFAVRKGNYKVVTLWKGAKPQLYDLEKDIGEKNDLADLKPDRVAEIEALRKKWNTELMEPTFLGLIHRKNHGKKKK